MKVQPKPAYAMRRDVLGWLCIGIANVLRTQNDGLLQDRHEDYLNDKELRVWTTAMTDLDHAEKRLRKLGKHMLGTKYGGR